MARPAVGEPCILSSKQHDIIFTDANYYSYKGTQLLDFSRHKLGHYVSMHYNDIWLIVVLLALHEKYADPCNHF